MDIRAILLGALMTAACSSTGRAMNFVDFSTWTDGPTTQSVNWAGNGTVTVSGITFSSPRSGFPTSYTETWNNSDANFPALLGSAPISASELWFNAQSGSQVSFDLQFSQAFTSQKTLFFDDIDLYSGSNSEAVNIQAFDFNGVALDLSGWTQLMVDGRGTNQTSIYNTVSFSANNTIMSILPSTALGGVDSSQALIFLTPSAGQDIYRIHAEAPSWYSGSSTSGWEIGAFTAVPESSSILLLGAAAFIVCHPRRRTVRA